MKLNPTRTNPIAFWIEYIFSLMPFLTFSRSQSTFLQTVRRVGHCSCCTSHKNLEEILPISAYAAHDELVLSRILFEMVSLEASTFSSSKTKAKSEVMRQTNDLCLFSSPYPHHRRKIGPTLQCSRPYYHF